MRIFDIVEELEKERKKNKELEELCNKYEEEHSTTFKQWKKEIEEYQLELQKADSITQSCIFQGKQESEISFRNCLNKMTDYKSRIDKAIEYVEHLDNVFIDSKEQDNIVNILKGDNK